jgi:hypothetical protein
MLSDKVGKQVGSRSRDLRRAFIPLTAFSIACLTSFAAWAFIDFERYYRSVRPAAPMTCVVVLVVGVGIVSIGLMTKLGEYSWLGIGFILSGVGNGIPVLPVTLERSRQLLPALLVASVVACFIGLVVHLKAREHSE